MHITNGSGTGGDGPAITNDLNPTVPKTVGDVLLEPAVIRVAVVVVGTCIATQTLGRDNMKPLLPRGMFYGGFYIATLNMRLDMNFPRTLSWPNRKLKPIYDKIILHFTPITQYPSMKYYQLSENTLLG